MKSKTYGTGSSTVVTHCQSCGNPNLESLLFLGYLPPVNTMPKIGSRPVEQPSYPADLLSCNKCNLVQLGLIVDPTVLFPKEYPYTSSTTKILRDNFTRLAVEAKRLINLNPQDLIIDIGSNDGNLLSNFMEYRVLGITPEDIGKLAIQKGIPTILDYFTKKVVTQVKKEYGKAKLITATNVFAHIEDVNQVTTQIISLLKKDGVFISESHYLLPLIQGLQYDTIYHEHLRYYSLHSLKSLLERHGLEVFYAKKIPTHGGSIRVYAARKGLYQIDKSIKTLLEKEKEVFTKDRLRKFKSQVMLSKIKLYSLLLDIKNKNKRIYGISAPSRGSTLINYVGLDNSIVDCILEIKGSYKIGHYMPGTLIPVLDETKLYQDQPEYAFLFSWHIAKELMPKIKSKGFKGDFIVPLPQPRVIKNKSV